ncbi:MAG: hypothetical protein SVJ22_05055 [Halobacteriota archaeon]|nr:hypothetical protein [Halobacteriota archaeon]
MDKKYLIFALLVIVLVTSAGAIFWNTDTDEETAVNIMKEIEYDGKAEVGAIDLALKDEDISNIEVFLGENLPVSFSTEKDDWITPKYYTVIPSSEFNSLKETLWEDEDIDINALKNEDGDIYASFESCFGKNDYNMTELQEHLGDKYPLEIKEVNWILVRFESHLQYKEIEHTLDLLKEENNVIRIFPEVAAG